MVQDTQLHQLLKLQQKTIRVVLRNARVTTNQATARSAIKKLKQLILKIKSRNISFQRPPLNGLWDKACLVRCPIEWYTVAWNFGRMEFGNNRFKSSRRAAVRRSAFDPPQPARTDLDEMTAQGAADRRAETDQVLPMSIPRRKAHNRE